jgi:hypothetical protein
VLVVDEVADMVVDGFGDAAQAVAESSANPMIWMLR